MEGIAEAQVMDAHICGWKDECVDVRMDTQMEVWIDWGWVGGWIQRCMDGWVGGWMCVWMDE
jgi:hypothetical protein